ncbi:hypothetical protein [Streptomyces sp. CC210A]|uniref:hypothetical protein n=1 Tax=Streptomyces sp. CC210A TaxID=2898184 RepID=UPI0027E4287D|nr:hypothetical protein [Streptomyces sp. CC210A]
MAVELSGRATVSCAFRPPGLRAGLAAGAGALLVWAAWGVLRTRRRARSAGAATEAATGSSPVRHRAFGREPIDAA